MLFERVRIHTHTHTHTHIYEYIYRERERRERETYLNYLTIPRSQAFNPWLEIMVLESYKSFSENQTLFILSQSNSGKHLKFI
jgi:hypothetical protein